MYMHVGIDIRHLCTERPTGIAHYTLSILPSLLQDISISWTLFTSGSARTLRHIPSFLMDLAERHEHITLHAHKEPNRLLNLRLLFGLTTLDDLVASPVDAWFFPNINFIRTEKPYFITAHDLSFDILPECYSPKTRLWHRLVNPRGLYLGAKHVFAVSQSTASDLQNLYGVSPECISVTPLACNDTFGPKETPQDRNILRSYEMPDSYFLCLSTIEPRKNHLGMIEGYIAWRDQDSSRSTPLYIIGAQGYQSGRVRRFAKRSLYTEDIRFIPYIPSDHRGVFLRHADALLFCSLYEGFGLPVLESLACGTPVLTSNISALLEHQYSSVVHVHPWHVNEIAEGIHSLSSISSYQMQPILHSWEDVTFSVLKAFKSSF